MLFTSWEFILAFLPITFGIFFAIPAHWTTARKVWLASASLFFYGWWKIEYVPLLLASIGINYGLAHWIAKRGGSADVGKLVTLAVAINLGILGFYKYTNFLLQTWGWISREPVAPLPIVLPLAISFYTFTQIGYVVDVARNPTLHYRFWDYILFVLFFPHLIAGPIVRHWEIIPQYAGKLLRIQQRDLAAGVALFLMGLYKKTLLADPVAVYADAVWGQAAAGQSLSWFAAWVGTIAYGLQIYFDFSGYSDMAIGLARVFGIRFPVNFDSPYQATHIAEFWKRWHMSLTRFLREYVYLPLGGNRRGLVIQVRNVMLTFLLSGLWHGAGWTFVIWGALHGSYLAIYVVWSRIKLRMDWALSGWGWRVAGCGLTFLAVMIAWVFFRSPSVGVAAQVVNTMLGLDGFTVPAGVAAVAKHIPGLGMFFQVAGDSGIVDSWTMVALHLGVLLMGVWWMPNSQQLLADLDMVLDGPPRPAWLRLPLGATTGLVMGACFMWFVYSRYQQTAASPFIYFNF